MKFVYTFLIVAIFLFSCSEEETTQPTKVDPADWETASPSDVGLDITILDQGSVKLSVNSAVHSLAIVKDGKLVYEKYYQGYKSNDIHLVRSVSKSFLSALVGIAVEQNLIRLDQKMTNFFPEYITTSTPEDKKNITIDNLLMMTSGFGGDRELYMEFTTSQNWIKAIMEFDLEFIPGEKFLYSTAGTHLLGGCLAKIVNEPLEKFAQKNLFEPMGITLGDWETDPQGYNFGGNNMFFTTRDMAKFGQLYLDGGKMNNKQILPRDWVDTSTSSLRSSTSTWGSFKNIGYGKLWWIGEINGFNTYFALGHGGQYILNIPEQKMIIVVTSNGYVDWDLADTNEQFVASIIESHFLNAFLN